MADLFATAPPQPGSLTPREERALFDADRAAWMDYAAPNMARRLVMGGAPEIATSWPLMSHDYQAAVYRRLDPDTRRLVYEHVTAPTAEADQPSAITKGIA